MICRFPLVEELPNSLSVADALRRLAPLGHVICFDSAQQHNRLGRYSFVSADPFDWLELGAGDQPFERLQDSLASFPSRSGDDLPPFQGGLAGVLSYDVNQSLERILPPQGDEFQLPLTSCGLYDIVVAFDHFANRVWIISQGFPETEPGPRRERATQRLQLFKRALANEPTKPYQSGRVSAAEIEIADLFDTRVAGVSSCFSEADYLARVERAIEYIYAGDIFQVNFAQRLLHQATDDSLSLYLRLREASPAPFAGYLDAGRHQIVSSSPERLLSVRDGRVETRPIKGTRPRVLRPEADLYSANELQASAKDRAENIMIVDLLRNDLSRVCRPESVTVTQLCGIEQYAFVQHLVSAVEGELQPGASAIDALRTAFPGGSITGAPKVRAMEIIRELEPVARGAYCGSMFYVGFDGTCDANILIRTITACGGWWQMPVGGGIVADSVPRQELEETWHKARGMIESIAPRHR